MQRRKNKRARPCLALLLPLAFPDLFVQAQNKFVCFLQKAAGHLRTSTLPDDSFFVKAWYSEVGGAVSVRLVVSCKKQNLLGG